MRACHTAKVSGLQIYENLRCSHEAGCCRLAAGEADLDVKANLASLFYSSPCALCIVDARGEDQPIVYVNDVFEQGTGYQAAEVLGKNCRFLQAPPSSARRPSVASAALRRAVHAGRSHTCKLLNFTKAGTPLWNQLAVVPVRAAAGDVTHWVGMQTFTEAAPTARVKGAQSSMLKADSHGCLRQAASTSLTSLRSTLGGQGRSSSYQTLTALSPELVSPASAALHGCVINP